MALKNHLRKMKQLVNIALLLLVSISFGFSQPYGNEWIDYSRQHYVFPITQTGVYRLTYETLQEAGVPVNTITPGEFRVFGKERQVPLRMVDGGDNSFDSGDYFEFFAERNDGWLDSLLYDEPESIANPAYSLYNDTLRYFLTWKPGINKRYNQETDVNFNAYTTKPYIIEQVAVNYNTSYHPGRAVSGSYSSFFVPGEGWGSNNFNGANGHTQTIAMSTPVPYTAGGAPPVKFHAKSSANSNAAFTGGGNHHVRWEIGNSNLVLHDEVFIGYQLTSVTETLPPNILSNGSTNVFFKIIGDQGAVTDFQAIHYVSVEYPKQPNLSNQSFAMFEVDNNPTAAKIRLDLSNANLNNPRCFVLGGTVPRQVPMVLNGNQWQVLIPNNPSGKTQRVIVTSQNRIEEITANQLRAVNGDGYFTNISAIDFEAAYLMIYHKKMEQASKSYQSYRMSSPGGAHNALLFDIDELYLQFGGGVVKHITGIRRLANYAYNVATEKPVGLFLMGKGVREANEATTQGASFGSGARKSVSSFSSSLIPSFGFPSSDICITNRFNNTQSWAPAIPTGRIAAQTDTELQHYLEKMQVYEANQDQTSVYNKANKEWQKKVLHFGGGANTNEHTQFRNYLNNMKGTVEGQDFGGYVTSYFKDNTNPFNPVMTTEVSDFLLNGVSLMTFFGHASANGFDQSIDDPSTWGNTGKYPMVIGNACYTGDIFQPSNTSASEKFILQQNQGAIGFLSSIKLGFASYLNQYTSELYRQMSRKNYGLPIAEQMRLTIQEIEGGSTNFLMENTVSQKTLHGDPAMKLNWHGLPEIDLTTSDIFFEPNQFDLATDSIAMNIVLTNLGRSVLDTFSLTVRRMFPSSDIDSLYSFIIPGLHYRDTFTFRMPVQQEIAIGINRFNVQADIPSFVPELYDEYGNNEVTVDLTVGIDGIIPVLPYNYAVVPKDSVVLKASTINPIAAYNTYRFEIDTTDLYNSPFKRYAMVSGLGGVKEVFPDEWRSVNSGMLNSLVLEDSMCYFWRVAVDSTSPLWKEHSFQYIKGKEGWGQEQFFQFKNGGFNSIEYDRSVRRRNFEPQTRILGCDIYDNSSTVATYMETMWKLDGQMVENNMCTNIPSIHVAVIDPVTFDPWGTYHNGQNTDKQFGNVNNGSDCRNRVERYFIFRQNSAAQLQALENMITNEVPDGHFLLIYTTRFAQYNEWQNRYPNLFNTMSALGAQNMAPGNPNRAFAFYVQKGDPSSAVEVHATSNGQFIQLEAQLEGSLTSGVERSTIIGPALEWHTVYWKQDPLELPNTDKTTLTIRGLDANKTVQFSIDTTFTRNDSIINFNSIINASQYPYLQLQASYTDLVNQTPAQVDRWHVLYETLPEAAIDGTVAYTWTPTSLDSMRQGQTLTFSVDVKNISHLPMDSLLVNYWVIDQNQQIHPIPYPRQDSLRVGESLRDTITIETTNLIGNNVLWMEVNPYFPIGNNLIKDQPELAHFNNVLQLPFSIEADDINPILDVTFDGLHILNGDIINPYSEILITLKDNNPWLVMKEDADTSLFGIYIKDPSGNQKRIPFIDASGQQVMQWVPATNDNLKFKIVYPARFQEEGEYELLVQGADKSGNLSGDLEYRVKFDVILESSITHMMNYPNPFSTKTRFVFTLTGMEVPDELIIQIMTVTGRVVREITQDQLGPIRIGRNISEYAWDGRDEFGDQLANGVYLYRVTARINGESIEHRSSGADQHFKKNWGKMYLMR